MPYRERIKEGKRAKMEEESMRLLAAEGEGGSSLDWGGWSTWRKKWTGRFGKYLE